MLNGPDVSGYQPGWTPAAGDEFVFVKATEGRTVVNSQRSAQLSAARSKGLQVGHYHFLWPDNAKAQAAWFVEKAGIRPGDLLVCDFEDTNGGHPTAADAAEFIAEVKRLKPGHKVGLYCNRSDWNNSNVKAGDFLWIAAPDVPSTSLDVYPWTFHQYSWNPIDKNWAHPRFQTLAELKAWARGGTPTVPTERIPFRGGLTCSCVVASLPWVEFELALRGLPSPIRIFQLGYRTDVSASAGTHARGGCVDQDGTPTAREIDVWRLWGWTMQDRSPFFAQDHAHGWPYKCSHLSSAARQQEDDWDRKDAGLAGSGQVQGRWPIKPWNIALRERKMAIADELGDALAKNPEFLRAVADAVLDRRSIKNNYGDNSAPIPDGKISTELALGHLGNTKVRVDEILNIVKDIQAGLAAPTS